MNHETIQPCTMEHLERYGQIYAEAFSGEPWNDPWKAEDAVIHVRELLESKQAYGLEYLVDGEVAGFILGTSIESCEASQTGQFRVNYEHRCETLKKFQFRKWRYELYV